MNLNVFFSFFWLLYGALKWSLNSVLATAWIETAIGMRGLSIAPPQLGSRCGPGALGFALAASTRVWLSKQGPFTAAH